MTAPKTQCTPQVLLPFHPKLPVVVQFDAPKISSNGGALLLRQVDDVLGLTAELAACLPDHRDPARVIHSRHEQARQRVYQIALGHADCNDADRLRWDPLLNTVCDRAPQDPHQGLSSQPTLSRLENAVTASSLRRILHRMSNSYVASLRPDTQVVILDIDATDDATHGAQQLSFFHGYYDQHMYHPVLVFDGESGQLITAVLRAGNTHASRGARAILRRLIQKIRRRLPHAAIVVRSDSGFCVPKVINELERLDVKLGGVDYLMGMARNPVLERLLSPTMKEAQRRQAGKQQVILFTSFDYAAKTWPRQRRVLGKADYSWRGPNPRFVLTSLREFPAEDLYRAYCERGQCENYIKDFKNALQGDRLSCSSFRANFFRLLLHATAYRLMHALRQRIRPLSATLGKAQFDTLCLHLLRVAAVVKESARRILVQLPKAFPQADTFHDLLLRLNAEPAPS